jgi:molecular chaperone IbpA
MFAFDFSPLFRSTVGFDRLAQIAEQVSRVDDSAVSYPPYNIEKADEDSYRVTLAVAGFADSELAVEVKENALIIAGRKPEKSESGDRYLRRGIAARDFVRRFEIADHVRVVGATLESGLLHVDLVRELPEAMKPRRIAITKGNPGLIDKAKKLIDTHAA